MINLPKTNNFITFNPLDPRGHTSVGRFLIEKKKKIHKKLRNKKKKKREKNSLHMKNNYEKEKGVKEDTMKHMGTQSMQKCTKEKVNKEWYFFCSN